MGVTAVSLLRYLRGRPILVGLPLLFLITLLPIWMATGAAADLWVGPAERLIPGTEQWERYLPYTGRSLGLIEYGWLARHIGRGRLASCFPYDCCRRRFRAPHFA